MDAERDPNPTRLTIAIVIFRHFGLYLISGMVMLGLIVWYFILPPPNEAVIFQAVACAIVGARLIQSAVRWVSRRAEKRLAKRPRDDP